MSLIKAEKISYSYPVTEDEEGKVKEAVKAVDGLELNIEPGRFICILGRNGSGKSTFAKLLNALLVPDEGTLWIDGMDTKNEELLFSVRRNVGMVFQNPDNQIVGTVVDEDVAFGPENIGMPSEQIREEVVKALKKVGMEEHIKSSPNKLSGGQKQRVAIAGILAMHPKCIVLDESTAMLDPKGREEIIKTALDLNKNQGITIINITHYMDEALFADQVFVMNKSRLIMQGTPREIFSKPEKLNEIGLRLPQIIELAYELRKEGLDIPEGIISERELIDAVKKLKCR